MNQYFLYIDRHSSIHRLDPRTKILGLLGIFLIALLFSDPRFLIVPVLWVCLMLHQAGAWGNLRKIWILLTLLFLYCLLLWPFFVSGRTPFLQLGNLVISWEGLGFGMGMGLRVILMLLGGILFLSTTRIEEFTLGLQRLGLPAVMGFALSLAFRWVPSLLGSAGAIIRAQRARGLDLGTTGFVDRIRRYPPLLVPLIGHQFRQTKILAMALEEKGFGPTGQRTSIMVGDMTRKDYLALVVMLIIVGSCLWMKMLGFGTLSIQL